MKIDDLPRQARIVATALKRYGMIVADNGSNWYVSGAPDPRWDNDDLHELGRLKGSDFEVVSEANSPLASISTNCASRRARVSGFLASCRR